MREPEQGGAVTIIDEKLLDEFRKPGKCEWCGARCRLREPAHVYGRGHGGGRRLDVRFNLISLGSTRAFQCECHTLHHAGERPIQCDLAAKVAEREKTTQDAIEEALYAIRRLPNRSPDRLIRAELDGLPAEARRLVSQVLRSKGIAA